MMFLRTVFGVFRGFSIYPELVKRNPFRAIFHLLLWCILLALAAAGIRTMMISGEIKRCTDAFTEDFGALIVSDKGLLPEKSPEIAREFYLPGNLRFDYLTQARLPLLSGNNMSAWKQHTGIFWTPRGILMWVRPDSSEDMFYIFPVPFPETAAWLAISPQNLPVYSQQTAAALAKDLAEHYFLSPEQKLPVREVQRFSFEEAGQIVRLFAFLSFLTAVFFSCISLAGITVLLFALMQILWKTPGFEGLTFGGILSLMIYASFPALAAVAFCSILHFSYVSCETVFFIIFFICQMLALQNLQKNGYGKGRKM